VFFIVDKVVVVDDSLVVENQANGGKSVNNERQCNGPLCPVFAELGYGVMH
jgi:hypothetical protein